MKRAGQDFAVASNASSSSVAAGRAALIWLNALSTWNCNKRAYQKKVSLLDPMAADIAVIQECAKPPGESNRCLWFGDKVNQGVLISGGCQKAQGLIAILFGEFDGKCRRTAAAILSIDGEKAIMEQIPV